MHSENALSCAPGRWFWPIEESTNLSVLTAFVQAAAGCILVRCAAASNADSGAAHALSAQAAITVKEKHFIGVAGKPVRGTFFLDALVQVNDRSTKRCLFLVYVEPVDQSLDLSFGGGPVGPLDLRAHVLCTTPSPPFF